MKMTMANMIPGLAAAALLLAVAPANAASLVGTGDPAANAAFAGGFQQATFTTADQSFASYTEGDVTLSAGRVSSQFANQYNSFGSYYDNDAGNLGTIVISFAQPVSAFAFNWGASDNVWSVDVFSGAQLLFSDVLPQVFGSNAKDYFGWTGSGITSVTLTMRGNGDWVFIDNLTYTGNGAVPEPATWAMLIAGFGLVGVTARRRRQGAVSA